MSDCRTAIGFDGEARARRHLVSLGHTILASRWRCRSGEIDLVARDGETVVFVEVRRRSGPGCGRPEETVGPQKQRRLARVAALWLAMEAKGQTPPCRFDVIGIAPETAGGPAELVHLKDAFRR